MNTAMTPKAQIPDIAAQITYAMRTMGVAPIPRNYELFYEAYIGSNPSLTKELAALGSKATQEELDELGQQANRRLVGLSLEFLGALGGVDLVALRFVGHFLFPVQNCWKYRFIWSRASRGIQ